MGGDSLGGTRRGHSLWNSGTAPPSKTRQLRGFFNLDEQAVAETYDDAPRPTPFEWQPLLKDAWRACLALSPRHSLLFMAGNNEYIEAYFRTYELPPQLPLTHHLPPYHRYIEAYFVGGARGALLQAEGAPRPPSGTKVKATR